MEALIHDLLELSRIGQPGERRSLVDPREVLLQLRAELKPRLEAAGIELRLPAHPPLVYCDRTRLYQVFSNLIGNAIDHMGPCDDARIEVDVGTRATASTSRCATTGAASHPRIASASSRCSRASAGQRRAPRHGHGPRDREEDRRDARRTDLGRERPRPRRPLPRHAPAPLGFGAATARCALRLRALRLLGSPDADRRVLMYPELFRIPYLDFPISTFGVMMAIAFLVGSWITARRMTEEGLDPDLATTLLVYVMLGGIVGSKLYFAIDVSLRTGLPSRVSSSRATASPGTAG